MHASYETRITIHPTLVVTGPNFVDYNVLESVELAINDGDGTDHLLRVTLTDETLAALNTGEFVKFRPQYRYELFDESLQTVLASGIVHRTSSFESIHRRRLVRMHNLQTIVSELLHEALGSLALCNDTVFDNTSPQFNFFRMARRITPYTSGVSKSSPIVSSRFWMEIPTNIPGLQCKRRFMPDVASDGHVDMIGMCTSWSYESPDLSNGTRLTYNDQAITATEYAPETVEDGVPVVSRVLIKPKTAEEALTHMRAVSLPSA